MSQSLPIRTRLASPTLARLPPLTALRAFVATARHLNFTKAADELYVTSAAIGQQIRLLEDHFGQPLFVRNRGSLILTEAGHALMPGLTDAFERVLDAVSLLGSETETAPIRVSVAPSFASKWLIPRLAGLRQRLPELVVVVDASARFSDLGNDEADCAIRYGGGSYAGLASDRLFAEAVVPVCSPDFAIQHGLHRGHAALAGVPLLHEDGLERDPSCPDWSTWLRTADVDMPADNAGFRFSQSSLIVDAAVAGQGLGLGKLRLCEADLAAGRLVMPLGEPRPVEFSYFFLATPHKARRSRIARFRDWLNAEAAAARTASMTWGDAIARSTISTIAAE